MAKTSKQVTAKRGPSTKVSSAKPAKSSSPVKSSRAVQPVAKQAPASKTNTVKAASPAKTVATPAKAPPAKGISVAKPSSGKTAAAPAAKSAAAKTTTPVTVATPAAKTATGKAAVAPAAAKAAVGKTSGKKSDKNAGRPVINISPSTVYLQPATTNGKHKKTAPAPVAVKTKAAKKVVPEPAYRPPVQESVPTDGKPRKNQAGLLTKELEHFRDLLLEKRREIVGDMSSMEREALRSGVGGLSSLPVHMADMGTDNYEQEFTLGLVEKDRNLLREINTALAKIQNGTYGLCEGTGKPINKVRLEAQPWAKFSIEWARQLEKNRGIRQ